MVRIFSDHMASPIFGLHEDSGDRTLKYQLPPTVRVVGLPLSRGKAKVINTLLRRELTEETRRMIDSCYAVYLREPWWESWDVLRYAVSKKKKIFASYHGDWPDSVRRAETGPIKHLLHVALAQYIHYMFKEIARRSEVLFCVGKELHEKYGNLAKTDVIFANFLHSAEDISEPRDLNATAPYRILFVGHFEEYKGVKYLILAAGILKRRGFSFKLTLVGAGSLEQDLRSLVCSEGIEENIEWLGYIQHGKELMEYYRQADLFVLPSIAAEGTAKVLMEAMSQGVPVIAADAGGNRHLLEDGEYGIIVPPKDPSEMASAIRDLLGNVELRKEFVTKGLALARVSTREMQEEIVGNALKTTIPEIMGVPEYMASLDQ